MTGEKEKIFRRIREALTLNAPHPGEHGGGEKPIGRLATPGKEAPPAGYLGTRPQSAVLTGTISPIGAPDISHAPSLEFGPEGLPESSRGRKPPEAATPRPSPGGAAETDIADWLPSVGTGFEAQVDLFGRNSVQLKTSFHLLEDEAAAAEKLAEIARTEGWKRVAAHGDGANGPSTRAMVAALNLPGLWTESGYDVRQMESCDAGISECDALVAQTGSVLVTGRSAGGRALSVLPPHHVVLARRDQLVADLPAAFALLERKYGENYPSFIGFITGPSRTGDIERILVLGAHGPKKLTILCW